MYTGPVRNDQLEANYSSTITQLAMPPSAQLHEAESPRWPLSDVSVS